MILRVISATCFALFLYLSIHISHMCAKDIEGTVANYNLLQTTIANNKTLILNNPQLYFSNAFFQHYLSSTFIPSTHLEESDSETLIDKNRNQNLPANNVNTVVDQDVEHVTNQASQSDDQIPEQSKPSPDRFDLSAKQLAGLYIPNEFSNSKNHTDYVDFLNRGWDSLADASLSKIPSWTDEYILPYVRQNSSNCVFYPFGGPDICYATQFFPEATTYVLVGLEPIGNYQKLEKALKNPTFVLHLKESLSYYITRGYFVTSHMQSQLYNQLCRGGLPLMLLELARLQYTIDNIESVVISKDGSILSAPANDSIKCIRITFSKPNSQDKKHVYYIRADLTNRNKQLNHLLKFVNTFNFTTFIKSASYALHDLSFSVLRKFILSNSQNILQDDTGVPFCVLKSQWKVQVFGAYKGPTLKIFASYNQKDLAKYCLDNVLAPIPFKIGYGFDRATPNLILATEKLSKEPNAVIKTEPKNASQTSLEQSSAPQVSVPQISVPQISISEEIQQASETVKP